jgi:hypothetical protein
MFDSSNRKNLGAGMLFVKGCFLFLFQAVGFPKWGSKTYLWKSLVFGEMAAESRRAGGGSGSGPFMSHHPYCYLMDGSMICMGLRCLVHLESLAPGRPLGFCLMPKGFAVGLPMDLEQFGDGVLVCFLHSGVVAHEWVNGLTTGYFASCLSIWASSRPITNPSSLLYLAILAASSRAAGCAETSSA